MAEYTFEELKKKKVDDLREIAKGLEHEAVQGYTQLRKDQLLQALCQALGIEAHGQHQVEGLDKRAVKNRIQALKAERAAAMEAKDAVQLKRIRRKIHRLKHRLRAATV